MCALSVHIHNEAAIHTMVARAALWAIFVACELSIDLAVFELGATTIRTHNGNTVSGVDRGQAKTTVDF